MATQEKVLGKQLNIPDVATETANDATAIGILATGITADPGATATLDADYLRRDGGGSPITNTMLTDLNVGGFDIVNVGNINSSGNITIGKNFAGLILNDTSGIADEKQWELVTSTGQLRLLTTDDANTTSATFMLVDRTGTTVDTITFTATDVAIVGNATGDSTPTAIDHLTRKDYVDGELLTHTGDATIHFIEAAIDHANILSIGTNTHTDIDLHIGDATIHFIEADIVHQNISGAGGQTHADIDTHIADNTIHYTVGTISHNSILDNGANDHNAIDNHISAGGIHYAQTAIDHTVMLGIGVNAHTVIDAHLAATAIHFTEASITITESQVTSLVGKYELANSNIQAHIIDTANPHNTDLNGLTDVILSSPAISEVLQHNGSNWVNVALPAASVVNTPAGDIVATTVQAAIDELDTDKAPLASPAFTGLPVLPSYLVAALPALGAGRFIYVSDATNVSSGSPAASGAMCFSNGTIWIDVTTGVLVV